MNILVAIPSKGRPYDLEKTILRWLNKINYDWRVFVEPQDFKHYRLTIGKDHVVTLPENDKGIGYAMNFIGKYAIEKSYDLVCRVDDDCSGFISKQIFNAKSGHSDEVINYALKDIASDFGDPKLGAVRFLDPRTHLWESAGKARKYTHKNCELFHGWVIRPQILLFINEKVSHNDDIALSLYAFKNGYYTLLYGRIGVQFKDGTNKGGFQMLDRNKLTIQTYNYLKEDFPLLGLKEIDRWYKMDLDYSKYVCKIPLK